MSGGCGNVVNPKGFPSFPQPERGGQGGDDFLFKAALAAALWLPLSPLPGRVCAAGAGGGAAGGGGGGGGLV